MHTYLYGLDVIIHNVGMLGLQVLDLHDDNTCVFKLCMTLIINYNLDYRSTLVLYSKSS